MKKRNSYTKKERYSVLKLTLRIITLGIAISALMISIQNKEDIRWIESINENIIEKIMFPEPVE